MIRNAKYAALKRALGSIIRVWAYVRVSTKKQVRKHAKEFGSLDKQNEGIKSFVKWREREGWTLEYTEPDPAESGDTLDRAGLQNVLKAAREGKFDVLVVYNYDRLSREWAQAKIIISELERCGVTIWVVAANTTVSVRTPEEMSRAMDAFKLAEIDLFRIRYRKNEDGVHTASTGHWSGAWAPGGYRKSEADEGPQLIIDSQYAKIIKEIFERIAAGESVGTLLDDFRRRGIRTPSRIVKKKKGKGGVEIGRHMFQWKHIIHIIKNPNYAGYTFIRDYDVRSAGEREPIDILPDKTAIFPGKHASIVTPALWKRAMAALEGRERKQRKPRDSDTDGRFILQGSAFCGCCGDRLTPRGPGNGKGTYTSLRVAQKSHGIEEGCTVRNVPAKVLEDAILTMLAKVAENPNLLKAVVDHTRNKASGPADKKYRELEAAKKDYENRSKQLVESISFTSSSTVQEKLVGEMEIVDKKIREISRGIDELYMIAPASLRSEAGIRALLPRLSEVKAESNRGNLKKIMKSLISRVTVNHVKTTGEIRQLRVDISLRHKNPALGESKGGPMRILIEVALRSRGYNIIKPFSERRDFASGQGSAVNDHHPLKKLAKYEAMAATMKQRMIANSVGKTPAHVCQILSLGKIDASVREKILSAPNAIQSLFSLNWLMSVSKMSTVLQDIRVRELVDMPPPKAA